MRKQVGTGEDLVVEFKHRAYRTDTQVTMYLAGGHLASDGRHAERVLPQRSERNFARAAFTMIEVVFAVAIVGVLVVALYAAIAVSVSQVRAIQENERVTQILSEKLDTVRLYNWTQLTNSAFLPTNFTVGIDPFLTNSTSYYTGSIAIVQATNSGSYQSNLLQVTVTMSWLSGSRPQSRSMSTYVAKYGLQSYIMR